MGGIETVRIIHRIAAVTIVLMSVYHVIVLGYKIWVRRVEMTMLPGLKDVTDALDVVRYNLGLTKEHPRMPRYNFGEKVEYWAMVWGTVVMAITGLHAVEPDRDHPLPARPGHPRGQGRARRRSRPGRARHPHLALLQRAREDVQQEHVQRQDVRGTRWKKSTARSCEHRIAGQTRPAARSRGRAAPRADLPARRDRAGADRHRSPSTSSPPSSRPRSRRCPRRSSARRSSRR